MLKKHNSRRSFLKNASVAGISLASSSPFISSSSVSNITNDEKTAPLTFLFQGDSITDGNRGRSDDPNHIMGHGYAFSLASRLGAEFAGKQLQFYNRGTSGNTLADLAARWQKDTLDLKPGVLSILVGINDVNQAIDQEISVAADKFAEIYRSLLNQTKAQLNDCIFVLCEPFILPVGRVKKNPKTWQVEVEKLQKITYSLAEEYNAVYLPLQNAFNAALARASADYWIWDGVHPTVAGHDIITQEWLKQVSKRLHFLKKLI